MKELKFDELQEVNGGGKVEDCISGAVAAGFFPASIAAGIYSGGLAWAGVPTVGGVAYDKLKKCFSKN